MCVLVLCKKHLGQVVCKKRSGACGNYAKSILICKKHFGVCKKHMQKVFWCVFKSYVKSTWVKLHVKSFKVLVESICKKAFSYVKSTLVCVKSMCQDTLVCVQVLCKKHMGQVACKTLQGSCRKYMQKAFSHVKSTLVCVKSICKKHSGVCSSPM